MQSFYFLQYVNDELMKKVEELTKPTTVFINEVHIVPGKTTIKYDLLSMDGFEKRELFFFNHIKK